MHFEEAIKLRNNTDKIFWDTLKKPYPFAAPFLGDKRLHSIPALGLGWKGKEDYQFVIHVTTEQDRKAITPIIEDLQIPKEEVIFQITGPVTPYNRHVYIGAPVSHCDYLARELYVGTLGWFVRKAGQPEDLFILSNNHVLANLNLGQRGRDPILLHQVNNTGDQNIISQDSELLKRLCSFMREVEAIWIRYKLPLSDRIPVDAGVQEDSRMTEVAILADYKELKHNSTNLVDAAIARVNDPKIVRLDAIKKIGKLKGYCDKDDIPFLRTPKVTKVGRASLQTWGRIAQFATVTGPTFEYKSDLCCRFADMIAIESEGDEPFSVEGDSGSLIVTEDGYAVALLVGGTKEGIVPQITYAIPISTVLNELGVELVKELA